MGNLPSVNDFFPSLPKKNKDTPGADQPASNYKQGAEDNLTSKCSSCFPSAVKEESKQKDTVDIYKNKSQQKLRKKK